MPPFPLPSFPSSKHLKLSPPPRRLWQLWRPGRRRIQLWAQETQRVFLTYKALQRVCWMAELLLLLLRGDAFNGLFTGGTSKQQVAPFFCTRLAGHKQRTKVAVYRGAGQLSFATLLHTCTPLWRTTSQGFSSCSWWWR